MIVYHMPTHNVIFFHEIIGFDNVWFHEALQYIVLEVNFNEVKAKYLTWLF